MKQGRGVAIVLGTRPEMVKLAGIIKALGDDARVIHTGQHYDASLSSEVWTSMGLPVPSARLNVGGTSRASQIASALAELDAHFEADPPAVVVVQGDTNATLSGALAANARGIPLIHVEAGLRSFDRNMPEEHNRIMVDHLADVLCAPTQTNLENLLGENIPQERIRLTGNTVFEAVESQLLDSDEAASVLSRVGVRPDSYVLATVHRPENTDDIVSLFTILNELRKIKSTVVLPLHPRTRATIETHELGGMLEGLVVLDPLPPTDFLAMAQRAQVLVSDSGGIQEECSILKKPLLVIRRSTERPEVMGTFAARCLPSRDISRIVNGWLSDLGPIQARLAATPSPYGDGTASDRIANIAREFMD